MNLNSFSLDLHIHTNNSFDSITRPESIIRRAEKLNLDIIAITDHNSIDNALRVKEIASKLNSKVRVIIGEEISTDKGEIIGLFLENCISPGKFQTVIEAIKSQGGIVYLPHPFKRSELIKTEIIKEIDIIEVWNARSNYEQNYKGLIFAIRHGKLMACGSDSHLISELGRCRMHLETTMNIKSDFTPQNFLDLIKEASKIKIIGTNKNYAIMEFKSQFIKIIKKRTLSPLKYLIKYLPVELIYNWNSQDSITILLEKNKDEPNFRVEVAYE